MSKKIFVTVDADINAASSGDNTLITAQSDKRIYVWQILFIANGAVNVKFKHGSTEFNSVAWPMTAQGSDITLPYTDEPWWKCDVGEDFVVNLSGAVQTIGRIYYTYES